MRSGDRSFADRLARSRANADPSPIASAAVEGVLRGAADTHELGHGALHGVGVPHAPVDRGRAVRAGDGAGHRGGPGLVALAVTQPEGEARGSPAVQLPRGHRAEPPGAKRSTAPRAGVEEEQPAGGKGPGIDER